MITIKILALFNFSFGLFHLFFWRLLKWKEQLVKLSPINRAVVPTLNICLTLFFFLIAYIFYFSALEVSTTKIGTTLVWGMAGFWFIRALLQLYYFEMKKKIHQVLFIIFVIGSVIHIGFLYFL